MSNAENFGSNGRIALSPRTSFILGIAGGIMTLCTIGFFVLLGVVLNGQTGTAAAENPAVPSYADTAAPVPSQAPADVNPISSADRVWGAAGAPVSIIVYSDIECPYCTNFHETLQQVQREYAGQVRIAFRHYPLSFHANAVPAAVASECAGDQGKFWEFLDGLFGSEYGLNAEVYESLAGSLGLNLAKFRSCVSEADMAKINSDRSSAARAGVSGTPAGFIVAADGSIQEIMGAQPFASVKPMIDYALSR